VDIEKTDIVVIGMGPGGDAAAGRLAAADLHVTGVEAKLVGGRGRITGRGEVTVDTADGGPVFQAEGALQDLASR
jgi:pyruvate/2-oxoglutarate dehydrogenase complex dihydrolipoamide dehydrogenase (E3) component